MYVCLYVSPQPGCAAPGTMTRCVCPRPPPPSAGISPAQPSPGRGFCTLKPWWLCRDGSTSWTPGASRGERRVPFGHRAPCGSRWWGSSSASWVLEPLSAAAGPDPDPELDPTPRSCSFLVQLQGLLTQHPDPSGLSSDGSWEHPVMMKTQPKNVITRRLTKPNCLH